MMIMHSSWENMSPAGPGISMAPPAPPVSRPAAFVGLWPTWKTGTLGSQHKAVAMQPKRMRQIWYEPTELTTISSYWCYPQTSKFAYLKQRNVCLINKHGDIIWTTRATDPLESDQKHWRMRIYLTGNTKEIIYSNLVIQSTKLRIHGNEDPMVI